MVVRLWRYLFGATSLWCLRACAELPKRRRNLSYIGMWIRAEYPAPVFGYPSLLTVADHLEDLRRRQLIDHDRQLTEAGEALLLNETLRAARTVQAT